MDLKPCLVRIFVVDVHSVGMFVVVSVEEVRFDAEYHKKFVVVVVDDNDDQFQLLVVAGINLLDEEYPKYQELENQ